jgi:hypothetical protein
MVAALAYKQMRDAIAPKPRGFSAIGVFLFFGAVMATFAATTLLRRGTPLDRLWALNPTAYNQLAPLGGIVAIAFLALAATLITAGIGWFRRRLWGWRLAVIIISTQVLGDVVNCVRGDWLRGGTGVIIAGTLLLFLLQPRIKATFYLESLSKKFEKAIADEGSYRGNCKIGSGKNISDCPSYATLLPHA